MKNKNLLYSCIGVIVIAVLVSVYLSVARSNVSPEDATMRFYQAWYSARSGGDTWAPLSEGLHTKSTYVSESFARSVERAYERGVDMVWCESLGGGEVALREVRTPEEATTSRVGITIGESEVNVFLVQDARGWWRIDEVDCVSGVNPTQELFGPDTSSEETIPPLQD